MVEDDVRQANLTVIIAIVHDVQGRIRSELQIWCTELTTKVHGEVGNCGTALKVLHDTARISMQMVTTSSSRSKLNHTGDIVFISAL